MDQVPLPKHTFGTKRLIYWRRCPMGMLRGMRFTQAKQVWVPGLTVPIGYAIQLSVRNRRGVL